VQLPRVGVGVLLVAVAALKIASTGWRFLRYYTGHRPYRQAGSPTTLLRILGPLVIASTVGVLGSGLWLIVVLATERAIATRAAGCAGGIRGSPSWA
jgi:hypothetical protein